MQRRLRKTNEVGRLQSVINVQPRACGLADVDVWLQKVCDLLFTRWPFVTRPVAALLYNALGQA